MKPQSPTLPTDADCDCARKALIAAGLTEVDLDQVSNVARVIAAYRRQALDLFNSMRSSNPNLDKSWKELIRKGYLNW